MASSALARLKKAANLQPIKRVVTLSNGDTFEFYATALTMAERERAQKMPGGDDPNGFALNLLGDQGNRRCRSTVVSSW
jgi:hypothetical protein